MNPEARVANLSRTKPRPSHLQTLEMCLMHSIRRYFRRLVTETTCRINHSQKRQLTMDGPAFFGPNRPVRIHQNFVGSLCVTPVVLRRSKRRVGLVLPSRQPAGNAEGMKQHGPTALATESLDKCRRTGGGATRQTRMTQHDQSFYGLRHACIKGKTSG